MWLVPQHPEPRPRFVDVFDIGLPEPEPMHPTEDVQVEKISSTTTIKPYRCGLCEFSTKYLKGLKQHNTVAHSGIVNFKPKQHPGTKPFSCDMCSFKSSYKSSLERHRSSIHNVHTISRQDPNLKVFGCETCSFKSKSEDYLEQHRRRVHANQQSSHHCSPEAICRSINASCTV